MLEQQRCEDPPYSPGPLNNRVLRSCLVAQCSYSPQWPRHQRRLANCDWMLASYTSGQSSLPRRCPTYWASSQRSHTVSITPCDGAWTPAPLLTCPSSENARRFKSRHSFVPAAQQLINSIDNNKRAALWADHQWNAEWLDNTTRLRSFICDTTPSEWPCQRQRRSGLTASHRYRTFPLLLAQIGYGPSAVCECGAGEQTVDHVVLQCPIHRPPHRLHGLTVLDDETIEWLLKACP